jgi:hypothetical protein
MINLAGKEDCDNHIRVELTKAFIPIVEVEKDLRHYEVPFTLIGKLGDFTFKRLWYYWVVKGKVPMAAAKEMYANPNGVKDVRVAGHCGCPPPEEWARNDKYEKDPVNGFVDSYHIDTQEGLNMFVQVLRKYKLVPQIEEA